MFIIDTSSHSDISKKVELAKYFYFDTQVGGGKINWPGQLAPPLILSMRKNATKKTAEFNLNYVKNK